MKNLFKAILLIVFCGILPLSTNAENTYELADKISNSSAPFHLSRSKKDDGTGIKGKLMISAVVGLNLLKPSLLLQYQIAADTDYGAPLITSSSQTPMLNLGLDFGLAKKVSIGVAFGYQKVTLKSSYAAGGGYGDYDPNTGNYVGLDLTDTWTKIHIGVRGDYYILAKDEFSLYTGLKAGYNMFSVTSTFTSVDPNYVNIITSEVIPSVIAVQPHFGFSYYFGNSIGFNTEVGLAYGGPYVFAAGLAIKI